MHLVVDGEITPMRPKLLVAGEADASNGTYVSVEPFHLFRYLDEQSLRFNHRKWTDASGSLRPRVYSASA